MNERIKLLSLQASDSIPDDVSAEHAMYIFQKKFAELIVAECADVAWRNTPETEELEYSHLISDKIKQHFGVEE